jgi:hypothetical protein
VDIAAKDTSFQDFPRFLDGGGSSSIVVCRQLQLKNEETLIGISSRWNVLQSFAQKHWRRRRRLGSVWLIHQQ